LDAAALAAVHRSAFDAGWTAADLAQFIGERGAFAIAAETDSGEVAGFILCRLIAGEAEMLTLAVNPAHRRQGVGAALVAEALGVAAAQSEAMFLEVAADNPGAQALYIRAGFEPVGRRAGYYGRPSGGSIDAIVMRRALNS
jgi:ribosomal-protein-alanine N-acetyltransferase